MAGWNPRYQFSMSFAIHGIWGLWNIAATWGKVEGLLAIRPLADLPDSSRQRFPLSMTQAGG